MSQEIIIRDVKTKDAAQILDIYSPYILNSAITFELETPTVEAFADRISKIAEKYPYLVAEVNGKVIAYVYATQFRERAAYDWTCESSIYLADEVQGTRINGNSLAVILYEKLFAALRQMKMKQVIGVITLPNEKSVRFHEKMGFQKIGVFPSVGFKQNVWHDVLFATKFL